MFRINTTLQFQSKTSFNSDSGASARSVVKGTLAGRLKYLPITFEWSMNETTYTALLLSPRASIDTRFRLVDMVADVYIPLLVKNAPSSSTTAIMDV